MDRRTNRKYPHSTGLRPLPWPLPKKRRIRREEKRGERENYGENKGMEEKIWGEGGGGIYMFF